MRIIGGDLTIVNRENEFTTVVVEISLTSKVETKEYSTKD